MWRIRLQTRSTVDPWTRHHQQTYVWVKCDCWKCLGNNVYETLVDLKRSSNRDFCRATIKLLLTLNKVELKKGFDCPILTCYIRTAFKKKLNNSEHVCQFEQYKSDESRQAPIEGQCIIHYDGLLEKTFQMFSEILAPRFTVFHSW